MKKLIATITAAVSIMLFGAAGANAHYQAVYNTGWSCQGSPWGQIVPYAPGYWLYCGLAGTQFYWFMVHGH